MWFPSGLQSFAESQLDSLMGIYLHVTGHFVSAFNIFCLFLIFTVLIIMCLGLTSFSSSYSVTLCCLDLDVCILSQVRKFFSLFRFMSPRFFLFSGTAITELLVKLIFSQRLLKLSSFFFLFSHLFISQDFFFKWSVCHMPCTGDKRHWQKTWVLHLRSLAEDKH